MKTKIFLATLALLMICACFYKQILGASLRFILKIECDCEMAYRSLDWREGELVFSHLVIFDPTFDAHIEEASLRLDWRSFPKKLHAHLRIDRPHVSFVKKRDLPAFKESWLDLSFCVNDGTVEWDGLARFSFDQNHFDIYWGESGASLILGPKKVEAELKQFRANLLKPLFPFADILSGHLTGKVHVDLDRKPLFAHLKLSEIGISAPTGSLKKVEGVISYDAEIGGKWEVKGIGSAQGKEFPFACEGKGFLKRNWIESQLHFEEACCSISKENDWKVDYRDLHSEHLHLIQACAVPFMPELAAWNLSQGIVSGEAYFSQSDSWGVRFNGENLCIHNEKVDFSCQTAEGKLTQDGGHLNLSDEHLDLAMAGTWSDWTAEARYLSGSCFLKGGWDGDKAPIEIQDGRFEECSFSGKGWVDSSLDCFFVLDGSWIFLQKEIPFHCSRLSKENEEWDFDIRFSRTAWDIARFIGSINNNEVRFEPKSHLLGAPLYFARTPLGQIDVSFTLPWESILSAGPFLKQWRLDLDVIPFSSDIDVRFQYIDKRSKIEARGAPFVLRAEQIQTGWNFDLVSDLTLSGLLQEDGSAKGTASWKKGLDVEFEGKITSAFSCRFALPRARIDLSQFNFYEMEGILEGQGHLVYDGAIESDFDFTGSSLKIKGRSFENNGPVRMSYSSLKGTQFHGLHLHGPLDCIVDLLEYDAKRSHWIFHNAQVHLPISLLNHRFLQFLDKKHGLDFTADIDFASDFSTFICTMPEGFIPYDGTKHHVKNLQLSWADGECKAALHYRNHLHRIAFKLDDRISGRVILGEEEIPLTIDWEYQDALAIHAIEGSFGGLEASFHAEKHNQLIGSARLNFTALSEFLPASLVEVFDELKMGKGYELKGRLNFIKNTPHFSGILSGKQLELFGFQFRTLLAQVDLGPEKVHIYDVKISDTAGIMKIDQILIEGKEDVPWTIDIPQLTMHEFRPSLLQRPGGTVGPISPLVVRELKLTDFKGLLDDGKTYTAQGQLHFINSYKRGETIFDLPANVLSRIVGLDLELLIPVCGDLKFDLNEGFFTLTELTNAFSEGNRSEFFLQMEPPPRMDLDGNLEIYVKMKQFVLLKITESFIISIEGKLDDPDFHLTKKRFFGLY